MGARGVGNGVVTEHSFEDLPRGKQRRMSTYAGREFDRDGQFVLAFSEVGPRHFRIVSERRRTAGAFRVVENPRDSASNERTQTSRSSSGGCSSETRVRDYRAALAIHLDDEAWRSIESAYNAVNG